MKTSIGKPYILLRQVRLKINDQLRFTIPWKCKCKPKSVGIYNNVNKNCTAK